MHLHFARDQRGHNQAVAVTAALIAFPNHLFLGAKPQAVLTYDKAKQQRHG
jgi:hypothetical protein